MGVPPEHATTDGARWAPRVTAVLGAVGLVALLGGVAAHYLGLRGADLVYADREGNAWSWYAATVLALLAVAFALGTAATWGLGGPWRAYAALAVLATAMSMDEAAALHERLARFAGGVDRPFTWVFPGALLALLVGVVVLRIARVLPRRLRTTLVVAGTVFLLGALGVESVAGRLVGGAVDDEVAKATLAYHALVVLEEGLELTGALLALRATLGWLRPTVGPRGLLVAPSPG